MKVLPNLLEEDISFLKFTKKKSTPKMNCPYCDSTMLPIDLDN